LRTELSDATQRFWFHPEVKLSLYIGRINGQTISNKGAAVANRASQREWDTVLDSIEKGSGKV